MWFMRDYDLDERRAIKVLRPGAPEPAVQRFFNEARSASRVRHAGIVEIFDCGTEPYPESGGNHACEVGLDGGGFSIMADYFTSFSGVHADLVTKVAIVDPVGVNQHLAWHAPLKHARSPGAGTSF